MGDQILDLEDTNPNNAYPFRHAVLGWAYLIQLLVYRSRTIFELRKISEQVNHEDKERGPKQFSVQIKMSLENRMTKLFNRLYNTQLYFNLYTLLYF